MTDNTTGSPLLKVVLGFLLITLLSACNATSGSVFSPEKSDAIQMPSGFNTKLMDIIDDGRRVSIYTQMNHIGDPQNDQLLFPASVARQIGINNTQMNRSFSDLLLRTRRFEVMDGDYTVTREGAFQFWGDKEVDIVVDCLVTDARQEVISIRPYRKVRTQVKISVQMKDVLTGKNLFDGDAAVEGVWGDVQGEGTMIPPNVDMKTADIQKSMGNDYERALTRAFEEAVERIDRLIRPVGRVTVPGNKHFSMFGGSQHGFQGGDEVVVFRAQRRLMADGYNRVVGVMPIAQARCNGVGDDISTCTLIRTEPGEQVRDTDYTVLTDKSANGIRRR
ncbi:hypothetical protein [uncultured Desulfobacter sp.]|uniref:hypothetical protein n=1 Tax=uncultured Desulfobacter sp. TaxID=240139 RepID=UPI002AA6DA30|nr:hypothetical protein [uncultured Desulfobacter sp.]